MWWVCDEDGDGEGRVVSYYELTPLRPGGTFLATGIELSPPCLSFLLLGFTLNPFIWEVDNFFG